MPSFPYLFPRSFRLFLAVILCAVPALPAPALADQINPAGSTISGRNPGLGATADYEYLLNLGRIEVNAASGDAYGLGPVGGNRFEGLRLENGGTVAVTATGLYGQAYGLYGGTYSNLLNSGTVEVTATGLYGQAYGLWADANSNLENSGTLTVTSGDAIGLRADGNNTNLLNRGTVEVTATGLYGQAYGLWANGNNSNLENSGTVEVTATGAPSNAYGLWAGNNSNLLNSGTLTVTGGNANGLWADGANSNLKNSGTVEVTATYGFASGLGAYGDSNLLNSGKLTVTATGGDAYGLLLPSGTAANYGVIRLSAGAGGAAHELYVDSGIVRLTDWALDLRGFNDPANAPFTVAGGAGRLDFTGGRLILRPGAAAQGFVWGREYALADMTSFTGSSGNATGGLSAALSEMPWLEARLHNPSGLWGAQSVSLHPKFTRKTNPGQAAAAQSLALSGSQLRALGDILAGQLSGQSTSTSAAATAQAPVLLAAGNVSGLLPAAAEPAPWDAFLTPYYSYVNNSDLDFHGQSVGFLAGATRRFGPKFAAGFHLGLGTSELSGDLLDQDGEGLSGLLGLHGAYHFTPALHLRGQFSAFLARLSHDWQGGLEQYPYFADADLDSRGLYAALDAGYAWNINARNTLTPELGLSWLWQHQDSYALHWRDRFGNAARQYDLDYRAQDYHAVYATARLRWQGDYPLAQGAFRPSLALGLRQTLGDNDLKSRLRFAGSRFSTQTSEDDSTALLQAGLGWSAGPCTLGLDYSGEIGSDQQVHTGWASLKLEF